MALISVGIASATMQEGINHRAFGVHSGFPKCCVDFFMGPWSSIKIKDRVASPSYRAKWGYVPCPRCVKENRRVKVHTCTMSCYDFLKSEIYSEERWKRHEEAILFQLLYEEIKAAR